MEQTLIKSQRDYETKLTSFLRETSELKESYSQLKENSRARESLLQNTIVGLKKNLLDLEKEKNLLETSQVLFIIYYLFNYFLLFFPLSFNS